MARGRPLGLTMLIVVTIAALSSGMAAFARTWPAVVLAVTGRQLAWSAHIVYAFIPRQREVPAGLRGRVNGAFRTLILISNTASPCKALTGFRGSLRHVRLGANNGSIGDDVGVGRGEIQAPELEPRRRDALMTSWQQTLAFMIMAAH